MGSILASRLKRTLELTKMATKMGLKELTSSDFSSRIEQAKILTQSLSQLRGAAMKAGQLLSLDLDNYFPPEAIQILSQLQNQVAPNPDLDLKRLLQLELTEAQRIRIKKLQDMPFAAASMGQVYKAEVDSKPVVLKAQYPHLEGAIESDVAMLKKISATLCLLTGRSMNLDPLFEEIKETLVRETHYLQEAESILKFQKLFSSHAWQWGHVLAPTPLMELSTNKLLTLSYEEGLTLNEWIASNPSYEKRELLAKTLLELYIMEFFAWGFVQTDPNPGNFLVRDRGRFELVVLDYGASKEYSVDFRKSYTTLLKSIHIADTEKTVAHAIKMGLLDPRENEDTKKMFTELLMLGMSPFFPESRSKKFDFTDDGFLKENSRLSRQLIQNLKFSPPPYQLIFLHRKLGGIFAILRKLGVQLDLAPYWNHILHLETREEHI